MAFEEILNVVLEIGIENVVLEKAVTNLGQLQLNQTIAKNKLPSNSTGDLLIREVFQFVTCI